MSKNIHPIQEAYDMACERLKSGALYDMPETEIKFRYIAANMLKARAEHAALCAVAEEAARFVFNTSLPSQPLQSALSNLAAIRGQQ